MGSGPAAVRRIVRASRVLALLRFVSFPMIAASISGAMNRAWCSFRTTPWSRAFSAVRARASGGSARIHSWTRRHSSGAPERLLDASAMSLDVRELPRPQKLPHQEEASQEKLVPWVGGLPDLPGLPPRLQAVADLVPKGKPMADIGAHDARLCLALLEGGHVPHAIAVELEQQRLAKAQEALLRRSAMYSTFNLTAQASTLQKHLKLRVGSGLEPLGEGEASTVVIAGVGGKTIIDMLEQADASHGLAGVERFVLQPMKDAAALRAWMASQGRWIKAADSVVSEHSRKRVGKTKVYEVLAYDAKEMTVQFPSNASEQTLVDASLNRGPSRRRVGPRPETRWARPEYPPDMLSPTGPLLQAHLDAGALGGLENIRLKRERVHSLHEGDAAVWYAKEALPATMADGLMSGEFYRQVDTFLVPSDHRPSRYHAVFMFDDVVKESGEGVWRYKFGGRWWNASLNVPLGILHCRDLVERLTGCFFNGAVVNVYNTSEASIGWHADDEYHLGPIVATVSLGRPHIMGFRERPYRRMVSEAAARVELEHGSLLVMGPGVQDDFQHRVYKATKQQLAAGDVRVSITFHHHRVDLLEKPQHADRKSVRNAALSFSDIPTE